MRTAEAERPQRATRSGARRRSTSACAPRRGSGSPPPGACSTVSPSPRAHLPRRRLRPGRDDAADGPARRANGPRHRDRHRRAAGYAGGGDAAALRPSPVQLRTRRPDRRRTGSGRSVRPRLRPAAALPPATACRRLGTALGRGQARRSPARAGLRPAQHRRVAPTREHRRVPPRRDRRVLEPPAATCASAPACRSCSRKQGSARPTAPTSPAASTRSATPKGSSPAYSVRPPPTAIRHDITTDERAAACLAEIAHDAELLPRPARPLAATNRRLEAQVGGVTSSCAAVPSRRPRRARSRVCDRRPATARRRRHLRPRTDGAAGDHVRRRRSRRPAAAGVRAPEPHAGLHIVVGGCASYWGAVDHHLGLLAAGSRRCPGGHPAPGVRRGAYQRLGARAWADQCTAALDRLPAAGPPGLPRFRFDGGPGS